jgi:hypothetical protein
VPLAHASDAVRSGVGRAVGASTFQTSIGDAYLFLNQMMDAYAQGSTIRLCQSYCDQIAGGTFLSTAFVYDTLCSLSLTSRAEKWEDVTRAQIIGDALLDAQKNDRANDGHFRQAYFAGVADSNGVYVTTGLSFFHGQCGRRCAWAAIALAQLYEATGQSKYLSGALWAANFIETLPAMM